jgi:hypothetical protein
MSLCLLKEDRGHVINFKNQILLVQQISNDLLLCEPIQNGIVDAGRDDDDYYTWK